MKITFVKHRYLATPLRNWGIFGGLELMTGAHSCLSEDEITPTSINNVGGVPHLTH